ncbi:hypothetical protein PoB_005838300, partial [Plakobranchus ocellatus]
MTMPNSAAPSRCFLIMTGRHSVMSSAHIHSCTSFVPLVHISELCYRQATGGRVLSLHSPYPRSKSRP